MNERIFELIQQQNGDCGLLWTEEDKEKFAELIVKECAGIANKHMVECESINYGVGTKIKQHFGVEE